MVSEKLLTFLLALALSAYLRQPSKIEIRPTARVKRFPCYIRILWLGVGNSQFYFKMKYLYSFISLFDVLVRVRQCTVSSSSRQTKLQAMIEEQSALLSRVFMASYLRSFAI